MITLQQATPAGEEGRWRGGGGGGREWLYLDLGHDNLPAKGKHDGAE